MLGVQLVSATAFVQYVGQHQLFGSIKQLIDQSLVLLLIRLRSSSGALCVTLAFSVRHFWDCTSNLVLVGFSG